MAGVDREWLYSMAHALALDTWTWPREDVPGLGLIDGGVDLSYGGEANLQRTPGLSVLGLEQFGMGDRPGNSFRVHTSEDKLSDVSGPGLGEAGRYRILWNYIRAYNKCDHMGPQAGTLQNPLELHPSI
uniref:Uncharacterized protein n=1 Tax=Oryza sativa subsp. japonica TaxID=39947 RepID=Q5Z5Z1_ORYSJ|nr:hypothetical protein [Oryza sativa Japonica Group]